MSNGTNWILLRSAEETFDKEIKEETTSDPQYGTMKSRMQLKRNNKIGENGWKKETSRPRCL